MMDEQENKTNNKNKKKLYVFMYEGKRKEPHVDSGLQRILLRFILRTIYELKFEPTQW